MGIIRNGADGISDIGVYPSDVWMTNSKLAIGQRLISARMLTTSNEKEISHGRVF
jgi:hypothetical protein